jgi:transposase-like protein
MRYPASEKLEIISLVAQSKLSARRTLEHLGVSRATFYRWCDKFQSGGPEALHDRPSRPDRVWNRIPDAIRAEIIELALAEPALSPARTGGALHRHKRPSSNITITADITRASTISRRRMSILAEDKPSCSNASASNDRPCNNAACSTANKLLRIENQMRQSLR